jgi:fumarate reductase flavoprotein subunit
MPDYEPEKKELASRDVVARRMEEHIHGGKGVQSRFGEHLWLDITLLGAEHINRNLREVKEICGHFLGIDPIKDWIPVRPAQHYTMGGVRTNHTGESPTLHGLFAAGEAACWVAGFQPTGREFGRRNRGRRHDRRRIHRRFLRSSRTTCSFRRD